MKSVSVLPTTGNDLAQSVSDGEYKRLLGLPRSRVLEGDLLNRASEARQWYAAYGHPFTASRKIELKAVSASIVHLENDTELNSVRLAERLRAGDADALVVLAASAGTEVSDEVATRWAEDRPDEAFFLDRFAVAVTEHLIQWASVFLCRKGEPSNETLLPHLSPGCSDWDLADQHRLMSLLTNEAWIGPLKLLPSGALDPAYSVLAALGVTHRKLPAAPRDICSGCDLDPCTFRRAPYRK